MPPDPKPPARVRDPELLRQLHREWQECAICHSTVYSLSVRGLPYGLSLHHIHKHPRDDVRANLVMLCGDGVQGDHGLIEAEDVIARKLLGEYVVDERDDFIDYLQGKMDSAEQAVSWLERRLLVGGVSVVGGIIVT